MSVDELRLLSAEEIGYYHLFPAQTLKNTDD